VLNQSTGCAGVTALRVEQRLRCPFCDRWSEIASHLSAASLVACFLPSELKNSSMLKRSTTRMPRRFPAETTDTLLISPSLRRVNNFAREQPL
jgi:hypothetical protein